MKIKDGFILREVAGNKIVVPVGKNSIDFNGMINLNDTAAFIWEQLQEDKTEAELINAMMQQYEVDEQTAQKDRSAFVKKLKDNDLLCKE